MKSDYKNFTKRKLIHTYIVYVTNKKNNLPDKISEKELRKMTDKEFYNYCSKIRKKLIEVTKEVGEFEVY